MNKAAISKMLSKHSSLYKALFKAPSQRNAGDRKLIVSQVLDHVPGVHSLQGNSKEQMAAALVATV
jgi:hypothetical protein